MGVWWRHSQDGDHRGPNGFYVLQHDRSSDTERFLPFYASLHTNPDGPISSYRTLVSGWWSTRIIPVWKCSLCIHQGTVNIFVIGRSRSTRRKTVKNKLLDQLSAKMSLCLISLRGRGDGGWGVKKEHERTLGPQLAQEMGSRGLIRAVFPGRSNNENEKVEEELKEVTPGTTNPMVILSSQRQ